jgi:hypothetical protein
MISRKHCSVRLETTRRISALLWIGIALTVLADSVSTVHADALEREQAFRIHNRIAGVPPSESVLLDMESDLNAHTQAGAISAAQRAMENPNFYTVTLKNFAAPWTNRDQNVFVPLNDYTTLVIGMVRDKVPFNTILSADLLYVGAGQPLPAASSNDHYLTLEQRMLDPNFNPQTDLVEATQSGAYGIPATATAGAMTTRAAAEAFFIAGTNRAMFRFTLMNHMCMDLEQVHDTSIIPDRIRQDVSRSPGGDSRVFLNNCIGCHAGMDPLAQAFAYYDFDEVLGRLIYTDGIVQPKYFNNDETFADGFVTPDDTWTNYWRAGKNRNIGWLNGSPGLPVTGSGAKSMGQELAATEAFAQCQVRKVFKNVCLRDPVDGFDRAEVDAMAGRFTSGGYDLGQVFAESAAYCMGN